MIGMRVPQVVFKTRVRDESIGGPNPYRWQDVSCEAVFAGKRIAVFSLPGALLRCAPPANAPARR